MKKRYYLFVLLSLTCIFLFFISCPQNLAKGTVWKGEVDGLKDMFEDLYPTLDADDKGELECYFNADNTMNIFFTVEYETGGDHFTVTIKAKGSYTIDTDYNLNCKFDGHIGDKHNDFDGSMDGILNTTTGKGIGDFEIKPKDYDKYKGDWTLTKVKAY